MSYWWQVTISAWLITALVYFILYSLANAVNRNNLEGPAAAIMIVLVGACFILTILSVWFG